MDYTRRNLLLGGAAGALCGATQASALTSPQRLLLGGGAKLPILSGLSPTAAWGMTRILPSWTGPIVNVRRASDNATKDFYPLPNYGFPNAALTVFLSGAQGFITKLYDQSGNGNHQVQATAASQHKITPGIFKALPAVETLSTTSMAAPSVTFGSAGTIICAYQTKSNYTAYMMGSGYQSATRGVALGNFSAGGSLGYISNGSTSQSFDVAIPNSGGFVSQSPIVSIGAPLFSTLQWSGSITRYSQQGATITANASTITPSGAAQALNIGGGTNGLTNAYFACGFLFPSMLSQSDTAKVENYISSVYKIAKFGANILFDGNSRVAGTGATGASFYLPQQLYALLAGAGVTVSSTNFGVPGKTTPQLTADATIKVDPSIYGSSIQVAIIWEMINDNASGSDGPTLFAHMAAYCAARRAAGANLIVCLTDIPANVAAPYSDANRIVGNQLLLASGTSVCDLIIDVASNPAFSSYTNPDYADGIHLNNAGYAVVAGMVQAGLQPLI